MEKKSSGRERAYSHIRNTILTNPSSVGTFLNEREIADSLGISRTPVREAFMMLASEELIDLKPNRGAFVSPLNGKQVNDLFQARGVVETWSAQYCISHNIDPTPDMIKELNFQKTMALDDPYPDFIEHDHAFHCALVRATGNEFLNQMYELLRARFITFGLRVMHNNAIRRIEALKEHQFILDALLTKDIKKAKKAILDHLDMTRRHLD
ncbi:MULTISPECIES: GntR family transcriptional regulator [Bartonella]|uniref:GntR family transcriptional regulator n=1 Tax=Bartonella TaxID=773 RepID=UPI0018DB2048|nr:MULTISPECIES: GntR family transcriptional regulator [Bartonella]MBH9995100.1 GntR family transcriptional regulator [Bartonella sp. P0291]MBH9996555.1 GntR family transcriptional regulator [Bartonella sp. M0192]MBH9998715.1 GntR family transcriptional regulator [Bartonella sp. M0191]MBI0008638.1 GntR family transcriptional regulator [Bartonella sp. M0193]MBI0010006.1 GntR family transcriptional regulator [Bartonella sp. M0176]